MTRSNEDPDASKMIRMFSITAGFRRHHSQVVFIRISNRTTWDGIGTWLIGPTPDKNSKSPTLRACG